MDKKILITKIVKYLAILDLNTHLANVSCSIFYSAQDCNKITVQKIYNYNYKTNYLFENIKYLNLYQNV